MNCTWVDKLSPNLKQEILTRNLPIAQLEYLNNWPLDLIKLIFSFRFGNNKILQLAGTLSDISLRDCKPVDEPLKKEEWLNVYNNPKIPIYQKGLWLRQFLLSKQYPVYTELRKNIKQAINKLTLPKNISIDSELLSLEKDIISFKIECKNPIDLKITAQKLIEIANSDELKKLLDILKV